MCRLTPGMSPPCPPPGPLLTLGPGGVVWALANVRRGGGIAENRPPTRVKVQGGALCVLKSNQTCIGGISLIIYLVCLSRDVATVHPARRAVQRALLSQV